MALIFLAMTGRCGEEYRDRLVVRWIKRKTVRMRKYRGRSVSLNRQEILEKTRENWRDDKNVVAGSAVRQRRISAGQRRLGIRFAFGGSLMLPGGSGWLFPLVGTPEIRDGFSQSGTNLGQLPSPEEKQHNPQNHDQMDGFK